MGENPLISVGVTCEQIPLIDGQLSETHCASVSVHDLTDLMVQLFTFRHRILFSPELDNTVEQSPDAREASPSSHLRIALL